MQIAFSTLACPEWDWETVLHKGSAYGYQGVEIRLLQRDVELLRRPEFQPAHLAQRRADLERLNFRVAGLGSSVRFDYPERDQWEQQIQTGLRYVDLAHGLQADFVRVFGDVYTLGTEPAAQSQIEDQIVAGLEKLGSAAERLGVMVLMETHGDFARTSAMQRVLQKVQNPAVGVLWDTHHPWRFFEETLIDSWNRLRPWIRHTHWKDSVTTTEQPLTAEQVAAASQAHSLMSGHRPAHYVLFGTGEFPAADCLRLLKSGGYDGWYSLEWEKAWHPELSEPEVALPEFPVKLTALAQSL